MGIEYAKTKSVAKQIEVKGRQLTDLILNTMFKVSSIVGATLGPGGSAVLIERQEQGLSPIVTKDGVTVMRALGLPDATAQCILEAARDAAVRTAGEAGDGTTTATILSEAIVRNIHSFCDANPRISPQRVIRHLENVFRSAIEPAVKELSLKVDIDSDEGQRLLHAVATVSANGDVPLADAVMRCYGICGDEGNITIVESSGPSGYSEERIEGYPIPVGYEDSCAKFYPEFINDAGRQMLTLEKPAFLLYHGVINDIQTLTLLMEQIGDAWTEHGFNHNVVVVACGFSDSVLGNLALNFGMKQSINVFPLVAPRTIQPNSQQEFLLDLAAVTGAKLLDIFHPIEQADLSVLGRGAELFEANRTRSTVLGMADPTLLEIRIDEVKQQLSNPASELDAILTRERIAKLAGGIAKLHVMGASNGELKEKRDRAEDAVCAVRGAIRYGCLPGGAWTLLKLCSLLPHDDLIVENVLKNAFIEPFNRLMANSGITDEEVTTILGPILLGIESGKPVVYDFLENKHVDPYEAGILDSTPAVLEAIRNSISIASLLGTLGGTVVFCRDGELERAEARDVTSWLRDANTNPADERP